MTAYDPVIEAQLAGKSPRVTYLADFDFASGRKGYRAGFGNLVANGILYEGIGNLGSLSVIEQGTAGAVEEIEFRFAAPADRLRYASDRTETIGRTVRLWFQFFDGRKQDESGAYVEWQMLGSPMHLFSGTMGPLTVVREPGDPGTRVISVRAQNAWLNRSRAPFAWYSDGDQKARSPGDNIFGLASKNVSQTVNWPQF